LILAAGPAVVGVDPSDGGRVTSLALDGLELLGGDEPPDAAPPGWFTGCFPMAPYAGRLDHGRFSFQGRRYRMPANTGPHAAHGTVFDTAWAVDGTPSATSLTMRAGLGPPWPFGGMVRQTLELSAAALRLTLVLSNDRRTMPGALGFHPWFRRDVGSGEVTVDVRPARRYRPDPSGIVRELGADLGTRPWDDAFTDLAAAPVVRWPRGPTLSLESEAPVWVVYERAGPAVCVEPLSAPPNSLGTDAAAVVRPGAPLALTMVVRWDAEPPS